MQGWAQRGLLLTGVACLLYTLLTITAVSQLEGEPLLGIKLVVQGGNVYCGV